MAMPASITVDNNRGRDQFVGDGPITIDNNSTPSESILEKLIPHVATNALHDTKARANRRTCHGGTRGGFIEKLGKWIEDPEGDGHVHWVRGRAGLGKTSIAQTLCEKYFSTENSEGLLAAAHFFSRNDASRNTMNQFVPTVAYQLARLHLHLAEAIDTAIRSDPSIMGADWEEQFERLICEPCNQVDPEVWKTLPRLVVIDGLDECMEIHESQSQSQGRDVWERDGQRRLLSMIQSSVTGPFPLPLRFLIFSRPEHTITNFFGTTSIPALEQLDIRELCSEADSDIYLYLCQEFARLVKERSDGSLDALWPGEEAIQELTRMSAGRFIYVVTAVNYVMDNDPSAHPQERLDIILRSMPSKYPDLDPLDRLYLQILERFAHIREQLLLPLLQLITTRLRSHVTERAIFTIPDDVYRSRRILAELLDQNDSRHISILLSQLRSVLYVPDDEHGEAVSVLHTSFTDFLRHQRRSKDFHIRKIDGLCYINKLSRSSLRVLKRVISRPENEEGCTRPRDPPVIEAWAFNAWHALVQGIYHGLGASGEGTESLLAVEEFDVYRYINMLNDHAYIQPLMEYYPWPDDNWGRSVATGSRTTYYDLHDSDTWAGFTAKHLLRLSQVYAFLTLPPSRTVNWQIYRPPAVRSPRSESGHNRPGAFFRFFEEGWVAVLPKRYRNVCCLQLKLLIGCLWDPVGSQESPTSYCGSILPFHYDDNSEKGTLLKIFPFDICPSTLTQLMAVEDCEIWRVRWEPRGAINLWQVTIAPTANGDLGWITVSPQSSNLHEWIASFARERTSRTKEKQRVIEKHEAAKTQGAMKEQVRRVEASFRHLLRLGPRSAEAGKQEEKGEEEEREWERLIRLESTRPASWAPSLPD
ncbi:hypothetical protein V5O48_015378 [Marasmius crinis-equi]|uniref:Nephrocystin 3-like N-terminal domain-containing protein n=1 Tax=Marasmius crinis-equi TaxID=585013 RepID=A0ABR3EUN4_9AGAR